MNARTILTQAEARRVVIRATLDGRLELCGPSDAVAELTPDIRAHKAELLALLETAPDGDSHPPPAQGAARVFRLLIALDDSPPKWITMLDPGASIEDARHHAAGVFGAARVLRIVEAGRHE